MTIGILAAMDEELFHLKEKIQIKTQEKIAEFDFYKGTFSGKDVVLSKSGIGKANAAICTTLLIQTFGCDTIINTGSAAGLSTGMEVGDVLVASHVSYHDVDVTAFGYALGQIPHMPEIYTSDKTLVDTLMQFSDETFSHAMHVGLIVSGDIFVHDAHPIKSKFSKACALEMESGAVAQTCHRFNIPFVVIRSVSDNGEKGAPVSFQQFVHIAGENSAILTEFLISHL